MVADLLHLALRRMAPTLAVYSLAATASAAALEIPPSAPADRSSPRAVAPAAAPASHATASDPTSVLPSASPTGPVRYQLGLLVRGPGWTPERTPATDSIQAGHMANIGRMAELGTLLAAGPFENGGDMRGVFVFAPGATGLDTLLLGDPAIASRRLECRLYPWIAPPGIGEQYRRRAEAIERAGHGTRDSMVTYGWVMLSRGPRYDASPTPAVKKLLGRHLEYSERLRASGQLVYAGDIEGTGDLRGVLVMRGDSAEVTRAVMADPAVRAGRFAPRILRWWTAWGTIPGH